MLSPSQELGRGWEQVLEGTGAGGGQARGAELEKEAGSSNHRCKVTKVPLALETNEWEVPTGLREALWGWQGQRPAHRGRGSGMARGGTWSGTKGSLAAGRSTTSQKRQRQ